ncbi:MULTISPECIES: KS-MAT linker domain-containing protein [unclassified Bradyrhizobium]|uniref:KS-MAT linker domain-containing protein n=1 Tax=Bradyrhizobium sp. USDA 4538 TaxID=2817702 RepID=UPI0035C694F3
MLSAHATKGLHVRAYQLHRFLSQNPQTNLADLAYTLQIGREPMPLRWATIVNSVDQLLEILNSYLNPKDGSGEYPAEVLVSKSVSPSLSLRTFVDKDAEALILNKYLVDRNLGRLGLLWVHGVTIPWAKLHALEHFPHDVDHLVYPACLK